MVRSVANKVEGVTMTIFLSKALLYNCVSSFRAIANAGSIGMKSKTKSGLPFDRDADNFYFQVVLHVFLENLHALLRSCFFVRHLPH